MDLDTVARLLVLAWIGALLWFGRAPRKAQDGEERRKRGTITRDTTLRGETRERYLDLERQLKENPKNGRPDQDSKKGR